MTHRITAILMLILSGCVAPETSRLPNAGAINWLVGEYHCGEPSSPYSSLYVTIERRFVIRVRTATGAVELVTGRVLTEPGSAPEIPVHCIVLVPDRRFAQIPIPQRLYVTQGDSYQVLANYPFSPQERGRRSLPPDYLYFYDATALGTPTRIRDVLRSPTATANKTDAGNGSKAICRVSNVLRSPSPDPKRSANQQSHPR